MVDANTLIWFFVTLLLMGLFAGIEMAFYSANRIVIELQKKQGKPGASTLSRLIESPETFLATSVIGFTLSLVFFSLLFGTVMQPVWNAAGLQPNETTRLIAEIALATFIVLIFAEFIPRAFFRARSNTFLSRLVWLINIFHWILQPIASGCIALSNWILKYVFGVRVDEKKEAFTEVDALFNPNTAEEEEEEDFNTELFENASKLQSTKIRQCLVPRKEIIGVSNNCSIEEIRQKFIETKLSKLVVYEVNIDHIIGYVHQLDIFKNPDNIQTVLLPIPAVPETMSALDLITKFTRERKSIAWVVDEFGGTAGIITMEDALEEIFGEIHDEYDSEEFVEKRLAEDEYIFSGRLELDYISEKYELEFPDNESETLSGYIINFYETIPKQKERIIINNYEFDILNVTDTRIEMVKLKILQ